MKHMGRGEYPRTHEDEPRGLDKTSGEYLQKNRCIVRRNIDEDEPCGLYKIFG